MTTLLSALGACWPGVVHAAESSSDDASALPILLDLSGCAALDVLELNKLLAIEFQTLNVQRAEPVERVHISCGPSRARVTLETATSSNEVDLAATSPAVWPRLLALSVSELVIESRARVAQPPAPAAPPMVAPESQRLRTVPKSAAKQRVFLGAAVRRAVRPATWLSGPELGLDLEVGQNFSLFADVRAEFGSTDTAPARVSWAAARGAVGALVGVRAGPWGLGLGPGICVGYLRLSPTVSAPGAVGHRVAGAWGGPELVVRARFDLSVRWFALLSVDSGVVTTPVTGLLNGQQRLVDTGGAWLSGVLGVGAAF